MDQIYKLAEELDFDVHYKWSKYFVLCDWYLSIVKMFDDTEAGREEAVQWMREQKSA